MTPPQHRLSFGIQLTGAPDRASWLDLARRAEALGYSTVSLPDHFGDQFAPFAALGAVAAATERIRLSMGVLANDFRHPVVLAKEAATLDVVSGGRLDLGLGAGWMREEYEAAGSRSARRRTGSSAWARPSASCAPCCAESACSTRGPGTASTGSSGRRARSSIPRPRSCSAGAAA